jgi:hypothetical protein
MNSAIVYLLRSTPSDVRDIIKSLNSLQLYFLHKYKYPVIIIIENDFDQEFIKQIKRATAVEQLHFHTIVFNIPQKFHNISIPRYLVTQNGQQRWPLGYRHMCRFWSGEFLKDTVLSQYDYVWRMDSDAYITKEITYDVFTHMVSNSIDYAYSKVCQDDAEVCKGLHQFSKEFFESKGLPFEWEQYRMFATHVEIFNMKRFMCADYTDFHDAIDDTPGFYLQRWGDAPIRYIALTNFKFNTCKLAIQYFHGNDGSGRREQEEAERATNRPQSD